MEETKNLIFSEFSRTINQTKRNSKRIYNNINLLLSSDKKNWHKNEEKDFYKNATNFFKSKNYLRINKYNKTDIKFPFIKSNKKKHIINSNNNKVIKTEENSNIQRIYNEFRNYDKKYNDITKYFKFYITKGNNNPKMYINRNINNFKHISSVTKPKSRKYCFNAFQRIKSIQ